MENLKKSDKVIYTIIKTLGIVTILVISYFFIFGTMSMMNSSEFSKILIDIKVYSAFYKILNVINSMAIPIFCIMILLAIPYLIVSIILCVIFLRKYIKYKGQKENQIIRILLLGIIIAFMVIKGISLYPMTTRYEINVNSKVNEVSNTEVKEFLQKELVDNTYVYKIEIKQGFPDDYVVKIHYKGKTDQVKNTFLSDSYYDFIKSNSKDITITLEIKSIIMILLGDIVYIYFVIYILKEFKRISGLPEDKAWKVNVIGNKKLESY